MSNLKFLAGQLVLGSHFPRGVEQAFQASRFQEAIFPRAGWSRPFRPAEELPKRPALAAAVLGPGWI